MCGGVGIARRTASGIWDDIIISESRAGLLVAAGVSYDIPLYRHLSLTPGAEIGAGDLGSERLSKMWEYRLALGWSP